VSTHLSAQQVEQYRSHSLPPAELLDAGDHLVVCAACRAKIADPEQLDASFSNLRDDFKRQARASQTHLNYQQLSAYVDDLLDTVEREIVDSHLVICALCKEELRDLFAFKETLSANSAAASEPPKAIETLRERLRAWWSPGAGRFGWQLAGAMAALAFVALIVWLALRLTPSTQVVELQPTPSPSIAVPPSPQTTPPITTPPNDSSANSNGGASQSPAPDVKPTPSPSPPAGTPVDNAAAAPLLALNDNGGRIIIDRQGNLGGLETMSQAEQQAVRKALLTERLETPASLSELKGKDGRLMGGDDDGSSFSVIGPAAIVVADGRPTFRWRALEGATRYTVKIYDTNFNLAETSDALTATQWKPARALPPGKVYTWQVTAMRQEGEVVAPAPPAPEARFKVLDSAQALELKRSLAASRGSHLARGVIYTRAGLLDEAEREFTALLKTNPQSRVARRLRENVRALRREK
jgi:uncharacterized CHY-type Zn-finger protein